MYLPALVPHGLIELSFFSRKKIQPGGSTNSIVSDTVGGDD